jgi:hypothetical protein
MNVFFIHDIALFYGTKTGRSNGRKHPAEKIEESA